MTLRLYAETSAVVRATIEGERALRAALESEPLVTSALTLVELSRALLRARTDGRYDPAKLPALARWFHDFERTATVVRLQDEVLERARASFPVEPVRALDAIHLATVQQVRHELGPLRVASCDERVRRNAAAMGFALVPAGPAPVGVAEPAGRRVSRSPASPAAPRRSGTRRRR